MQCTSAFRTQETGRSEAEAYQFRSFRVHWLSQVNQLQSTRRPQPSHIVYSTSKIKLIIIQADNYFLSFERSELDRK